MTINYMADAMSQVMFDISKMSRRMATWSEKERAFTITVMFTKEKSWINIKKNEI